MILVSLYGGLGNQLFQYAAGRSLATFHNTDLWLDTRWYMLHRGREFALHQFNIRSPVATALQLDVVRTSFLRRLADRLLERPHRRREYREPHFHFDPNFWKSRHDCHLDGYWQSEKYFFDIRGILRQEFIIKSEYTSRLHEKAAELNAHDSVSVHVRRADYLQLVDYVHLSREYYHNAVDHLRRQIPRMKLYFFSDDPTWVRDNMARGTLEGEIVSGNHTHSTIEDFYLMSQCRHHITANSTFSWWAAWLNQFPDKRIVAPKKWFDRHGHDTTDLLLDSWVAL